MIIDMRCRPPIEEFRRYFELSRVRFQAARSGARSVSRAFIEGSMELFFEEMDEAGIEIGVVQGRNSPERLMGTRFPAAFVPNERIAELQDRHPKRLVGFGGVDASNTVHDAVLETTRCLDDLGLKGIFVEPGRALGTGCDDERLFPIYEACIERAAPVCIMTGPYAGPDITASSPVCVDRLATRFPDLRIICGHGCYPFVQEIVGVAYKHLNVYVSPDMYAFTPGGGLYAEAAAGSLKEQMLFGSAYPLWPMIDAVESTRAFDLPEPCLQRYFSGNARELLGLAAASAQREEMT
jgi:predicted TIM-barrel fold metal-dependent hydrolase